MPKVKKKKSLPASPTVLAAIKKALADQGKSNYWLAHHEDNGCSPNTIYRFLRGEQDVGSGVVDAVFKILGIKITIG